MRYPIPPPSDSATPSTLSSLSLPETPRRSRFPRVVTTTHTRTKTTQHGVETETITKTVTTHEDAGAEDPPSPTPVTRRPKIPPNPMIRVYSVPTPESLTPIHAQKFYLVTRGQDVGIFGNWRDVLVRTNGLDGKGIYEMRYSWKDALEVYTIAFNEGTISVEPNPTGPFADTPFILKPAPNPPAPRLGSPRHHIPAPDDLPYPRPFQTRRFYVITKGEEVGIFGNWHQVAVRVQNLRQEGKASWMKCNSWAEALHLYTTAFNQNRLQVFPVPGGKFDSMANSGDC